MIIDCIGIKNMKSFGNNRQVLRFVKNDPKLILLTGRTGSGKSTIQESIDFAVFGKVRGKDKKTIAASALPNRDNGNLSVDIKFSNASGQEIFIERAISPNGFRIDVNGIPYTSKYNLLSDSDREKLIGFNYDTYKSFVSMNINDFLNFMLLHKEDKQNLLNKLCNLERLKSYHSISLDISKNLMAKLETLNSKIETNNIRINDLNSAIGRIVDIDNQTKISKVSEIKAEAALLISKNSDLLKKVKELEVDYSNVDSEINDTKNKIVALDRESSLLGNDILHISKTIELLETEKCPLCKSTLDDHNHKVELSNSREKISELNAKILANREDIKRLREVGQSLVDRKRLLAEQKKRADASISDNRSRLAVLKSEMQSISSSNSVASVVDMKTSICNLQQDVEMLNNEKRQLLDKIRIYEKINRILGDGGIRNSVIKSLVKPINANIATFLAEIGFKYKVVLDDEFNASVLDRFSDTVNSETISNGEMKIINIIIALSYIKMMRSVKTVNVLFLDEVFVSIDVEYIGLFLTLLKRLSKELQMNIIIIHHGISEVDLSQFDRILKITNNVYSNIEEISKP